MPENRRADFFLTHAVLCFSLSNKLHFLLVRKTPRIKLIYNSMQELEPEYNSTAHEVTTVTSKQQN